MAEQPTVGIDVVIAKVLESLRAEGIDSTPEELCAYADHILKLQDKVKGLPEMAGARRFLPTTQQGVLDVCLEDGGCWRSLADWIVRRRNQPEPGQATFGFLEGGDGKE